MNRIYKVIYSKARQCYIVVSELAKSNHKSSQQGADHTNTPALARIIAVALAAGALTWGSVPGVSWAADNTAGSGDGVAVGTGSSAPKAENVAIGKGATISYSGGVGQPSTGDIVIGGGAHINNYIDQGGGIAIGANSFVENMTGGLERSFDFKQAGYNSFFGIPYGLPKDPTKMVTGVAVGQNTYARSGSIMLGTHNYKGDLGDVTVDSAHTKDQNMLLFSTTLGANSYSNGLFSSVTGAYSIASSDYSGGEHASKNFGATITGSLNSIESATSSNEYSGVANSIVGLANRTSNSNGSLIFGAGNEIKNSITNISAPTSGGNSSKALQDSLMNAVKKGASGGATLVIGGGNTADYTQKTQILGVKNTVTGTENNISMYNMIDGFNNTVNGASHLYTIGTNNTITNAKNTILFGDNRKAEGVENSVIIGNADKTAPITTEKKDTVIVGHNANATIDGGVAIGSDSIANVEKGQKGYYVKHDQRSEEGQGYPFKNNDSAWISRAGAVSVGDTTNKDQSKWVTRQITGVAAGTNDTDAVNVAQLKNSQTRFYSIYDPGDNWLGIFPQIPNWEKYKNEDNQGAQGYWSMAAGFGTSTGGIASTVIGSLSKIDDKWTDGKPNGFQGATAVSVGTLNFNLSDQVTDNEAHSDDPRVIFQSKEESGVANSIVGQGNLTKNSNGALIYGAGNIVTDSYRRVVANGDKDFESLINQDMESLLSDPEKAIKTLGKIVDISGGKVMAIGGGNVVDKAYDSQVMGVGNTVVGDAVNFEYKESPEVSNLPEGTFDEKVMKEASRDADVWTQYMGSIRKQGTLLNLVDGYYSTLKNGQNDYLIGTANEVTGDPSKNKSNIVFGDYHKLNNGNNNIIIGSADGAVVEKAKGYYEDSESGITTSQEITGQKQHTENLEDAVMIGHNADVLKNGGVALGAGSVASGDKDVVGYDAANVDHSGDTTGVWKSKAAAVSVGDKDLTRQITNVAAGTQDTDAVNVAQLKAAQTHFYSVNSTDEKAGNYNNDGAKGKNSLAAGVGALANGSNSVAIGTKAKAQNDALAVGESANAGNNGIAIGMHANAGYGQNMALGYYASVANGVSNSTALGYGSQVTKRDILQSDGSDGVVSVGKSVGQSGEKGMTRRIINVKDGVKATDAANVSQLTELQEGEHISIVDSATPNEKGQTVKTISVKVDGQIKEGDTGILSGDTVYNEVHVKENGNYIRSNQTVAENLKALDSHVKTNADNIEKNGQAIEKNSARIDTNSKNIEKNGQAIEKNSARIDTNSKNIEKNSQAIEKNSARIDTNSKNIEKNGQAIEKNSARIDTNSKNIEKNGQAIEKNSARIDTNSKNIEKNSQAIEKNSARIDTNSKNIETLQKTKADTNLSNITDAGKTVINNIAKKSVKVEASSSNVSVTTKDVADGPITYTVDVAKDLHVNSITSKTVTSDSVTAKTVTSDTVKTKNLSVSESASIGDVTINKGNQGTIDGLKNTAWDAKNITSGRAATEDQVKAATKNAVNYDDDTSKTITLREDTTIKNVANTAIEQGSKNAVNAGTVYNETRVKQDGKYVKASNTAGENLSVLDNQVASNSSNITNLNGRVNNLDSKVNKVGAGAAALAALHPLDFDPEDKWDFAVGYGNYRDANSVAVGAFYRPDDDTMFSVGTNFGNGENMINAGVSFKFGPKGKSQVRPGSTQEITELRATVARQDDQLKKQDNEIKELKAMVQQLMAKQDKQATTK